MKPGDSMILHLSRGNPGAVTVLVNGAHLYGECFVALVEASGLMGAAIWAKFQDECRESLPAFFMSIGGGCLE